MTPRRFESRVPLEQPVRFYKVIALSFLAITLLLLGVIVFLSAKRATITITTKESPTEVSLVVSASELDAEVATSTIVVERSFSPNGETEVPGQATGVMTIHNTSNSDQPLVATTRFLSSSDVLFRLRDRVVVPANGTITAEVYADEDGASGNVEPGRFTIPGLNPTRQQEVYGELSEPTSGGIRTIGVLSQQDLARAEEVLTAAALDEAKGLLPSLPDSTGAVQALLTYEINLVEGAIGDELSSFRVELRGQVAIVTYEKQMVRDVAQEALARRIVDETETMKPASTEPRLDFSEYADGEVLLQIYYDGIAQLNPESPELQPAMFFGKTRDEVRRYALALDHVTDVDISFKPAWMQTVPHVREHVDIIIKSVR